MLQNIKIAQAKQSPTNAKGRVSGQAFDDLVASIREKGVITPILARKIHKAGGAQDHFQVIAGNRRLAAAKEAGLTEIPAQIVEMSDTEALEAQIVENLQREDIHPLEEGDAYRNLKEQSRVETAAIAAKVGKSESYVKQRLFLTNLAGKSRTAYREAKINDGIAVLIAKLSVTDQDRAFTAATSTYRTMTTKEMEKWIQENIYSPMDNQPWLESLELMKIVGSCQECKPDTMSLFGPAKQPGACTSMKCWARKMDNYINHIAQTEKRTKVSSEYGSAPKGIKGKNDYVVVAAKGKDRCESTHGAVVAHGSDIGKTFDICANPKCKTHSTSGRSEYSRTPAEEARDKAARKKEAAKAKARELNDAKIFQAAINKIKYPLSQKQLDNLLDFAFYRCGVSYQQPAVKLLGADPVKKPEKSWDGKKTTMRTSYEATLRAHAEKTGNIGKLKVIFAMLMPHPSSYNTEDFNKAAKKL